MAPGSSRIATGNAPRSASPDPGFAKVVAAWPGLPGAIVAAITAMIDAASKD